MSRTAYLRPHPAAVAILALDIVAGATAARADEAPPPALDTVVITATRIPQSAFDLPVSIDSAQVTSPADTMAQGGLAALAAQVPGIRVQDRFTLSQDQQIQSRGYGARSSFGVRGLRLLVDGIPATSPDGQGETSELPLTAADHLEVMRGPFSTLYGASAGGVVQMVTADPPARPTLRDTLMVGGARTVQEDVQVGDTLGGFAGLADFSTYHTDGYRPHSAGQRSHLYAKLSDTFTPATKLTVLVNGIDQPFSQDPLGLTHSELAASPNQSEAVTTSFNTGKSMQHGQIGSVLSHDLTDKDSLTLSDYFGTRHIVQFLALTGVQQTSAGGIVDLSRQFGGADLRWTHKGKLMGHPLTTSLGFSADLGDDLRKGFVNNYGVQGDTRRNEDQIGTTLGQYAQAEWAPSETWSLTAGLRHTGVRLHVNDHYFGNGTDDSGTVTYDGTSPALGVVYHLTPAANLYATYALGFETPTFDELSYLKSGATVVSGFNTGLKPALSRTYEIGFKAFPTLDTKVNLALFHIDTSDEATVAASVNGHTAYQNAGNTRRNGAELNLSQDFGHNLSGALAATVVDARFASGAYSGNQLPGVPEASLSPRLTWSHPDSGFFTGIGATWNGRVYVDDANSDAASSYVVTSWNGGFRQEFGRLKLEETARVDNLLDTTYVAAVVVGDSNNRFFEPAQGRNLMLGVSAAYTF